MSSAYNQLEAAVFQRLLPQLEAEGFKVFLHPSRQMLPSFLQRYRPDAIAFRSDKNLVIEITTAGEREDKKLQGLGQLFAEHRDRELRVVYAPPLSQEQNVSVPEPGLIEANLDRVWIAFDAVSPTAALLMAWSVFEAAARSLAPIDLKRPQQPVRLVEVLASEGYVTPDEADKLRWLGQLRNEAAHGRLDLTLTREDLSELVGVTRTFLAMREEATARSVS